MFPLLIRSTYFKVVISFKLFNSTSATSLFNHFNGVSFEWALTHRSFPRILPDSSYFPGVILKFFSKFDVRMNYHQSNVFLQDLSNYFIVGSTFIIFIRSASTILGGVSHHHSQILKTEEDFLLILLHSLLSDEFKSSFGVDHIFFFSSFQIPSHAGAPHIHSLLAIHLFRRAQAISKGLSCHSRSVQPISRLLSHSSHLIQPV